MSTETYPGTALVTGTVAGGCCFAACWKKPPTTEIPMKIVISSIICHAGAMSWGPEGGELRFAVALTSCLPFPLFDHQVLLMIVSLVTARSEGIHLVIPAPPRIRDQSYS